MNKPRRVKVPQVTVSTIPALGVSLRTRAGGLVQVADYGYTDHSMADAMYGFGNWFYTNGGMYILNQAVANATATPGEIRLPGTLVGVLYPYGNRGDEDPNDIMDTPENRTAVGLPPMG